MNRDPISLFKVSENPALKALKTSQSVLLLQGPVGPFFDRLTHWLESGGSVVNRVVFSGGDFYDSQSGKPALQFKKTLPEWPAFLAEKLSALDVDAVVLFGQERHYHKAAIELCNKLGTRVVVLEEGYFRPGFLTMELGGVNARSTTLFQYFWSGSKEVCSEGHTNFFRVSILAMRHYFGILRGSFVFANYQHHRHTHLFNYAVHWLQSWARKFVNQKKNQDMQASLFESGAPYYFMPFQYEFDAQVVTHCDFADNFDAANQVLRSFAANALPGTLMVFKEHPHSRASRTLMLCVHELARLLGVADRLVYMVEGNTPQLVKNASGVVVINSTVGIMAIKHHVPLIVIGRSIYNLPPHTFQGKLDDFWTGAKAPDRLAANAFLVQLKNLTQVSADIYARRDRALTWSR
jgi:capsular polysaccharide export protein